MIKRIIALRDEAARAGDLEQVKICERALEGDQEAMTECERILRPTEVTIPFEGYCYTCTQAIAPHSKAVYTLGKGITHVECASSEE